MIRLLPSIFTLIIVFLISPFSFAMEVQTAKTSSGVEIWLVEDHSSPVISLNFSFKGGDQTDPEGKEGLTDLMINLMTKRTASLTEEEFSKKLKNLSLNFTLGSAAEEFTGSLYFLTKYKSESIAFANEALTQPLFDAALLSREKEKTQKNLQRLEKNQSYLASKNSIMMLAKDSPYARFSTQESIASITAEDLMTGYKAQYQLQKPLVAISGDVTMTEAKKLVEALFKNMPISKKRYQDPEKISLNGEGKVLSVPLNIPQTYLRFSTQAAGPHDPDWFAQILATQIFSNGSLETILNQEIREKKGLSYGFHGFVTVHDLLNAYQFGGETKNESAKEVAEISLKLCDDLRQNGFTQKQLDSAKSYLKGSFPVRFQSNGHVSSFLIVNMSEGVSVERLYNYNENIDNVSLEQINSYAKKLLDPSKMLLVTVGQPEGIKDGMQLNDFR